VGEHRNTTAARAAALDKLQRMRHGDLPQQRDDDDRAGRQCE
jgi:hypothetical protein